VPVGVAEVVDTTTVPAPVATAVCTAVGLGVPDGVPGVLVNVDVSGVDEISDANVVDCVSLLLVETEFVLLELSVLSALVVLVVLGVLLVGGTNVVVVLVLRKVVDVDSVDSVLSVVVDEEEDENEEEEDEDDDKKVVVEEVPVEVEVVEEVVATPTLIVRTWLCAPSAVKYRVCVPAPSCAL
jgi:hypothetical protein